MIRDILSKREISEFDHHRTYVINATFVEKDRLEAVKKGQPTVLISALKKNKGFWVLKKALSEDNTYPYQALLLKEARKIEGENGILIDELNNTRLITIVKDGIPVSTYISVEKDWRPQAIRLAASNNLPTDESLITTFVTSYWSGAWKKVTPFMLVEEWESQSRRFPISSEMIVFILVLLGVCYYGVQSYNDLVEKKDLEQRIALLEKEKQSLQETLNEHPVNANLEKFYASYRKTEALVRLLRRLQAVSPTSTILRVTGNKVIIDNFAPAIKDELKEYSPQITPQGVELSWN
jgi:hypothetical protein